MSTVVAILPNGSTLGAGWSVVGGPSAHSVLGDSNTTTYITINSSGGADFADIDFATYVLSSTQRCRRARFVSVCDVEDGEAGLVIRRSGTSGIEVFNGEETLLYVGPWENDPPGAETEWIQAAIDGVGVRARFAAGMGFPVFNVLELAVTLDIMEAAQAQISSPLLDQITSPYPTVSWNYVANGEPQKKYHVKVFTKAVVEGGSFDPETSANVHSSSATSSVTSHPVITPGLTRGSEYYAFVKTAKDFNGADWWGPWSTGVRFKVDSLPVVNVTAPPASVTDNSRPPIVFTYSDADGHTKVAHEVKYFKRSGGVWPGGFDPSDPINVPVWEKANLGTGLTETPTVDLENLANYRAYARVYESGNPPIVPSEASLWDFNEFDMNLTPPPNPLLSVAPVANLAQMWMTLTHQAGAVVPEYYTIQRSDNGGLTWQDLRGMESIAHVSHGTIQFYVDHEAPFNQPLIYRARATDTTLGPPVSSFSTQQETQLKTFKVWLKDPDDITKAVSVPVENVWRESARRRQRAIKEPLGRTKPVMIRGTAKHQAFPMTFIVETQALKDKLDYFLGADFTFLVQTPKENLWVEVAGDITEGEHLWDALHGEADLWKTTVPLQEVDEV